VKSVAQCSSTIRRTEFVEFTSESTTIKFDMHDLAGDKLIFISLSHTRDDGEGRCIAKARCTSASGPHRRPQNAQSLPLNSCHLILDIDATMLRRTLTFRPTGRSFSTCTVRNAERQFLLRHATPTLACLRHGNTSYGGFQCIQNRSFFFGSGNDNNDNSDDAKGKGDKDKHDNGKKDDNVEDNDAEGDKKVKEDENNRNDNKDDDNISTDAEPEPSPSLNNSSKYKRPSRSTISLGNSTPSNVLLPAHRLGFGDQAPRYPHLLALPVVRGPVFPGVLVRLKCLALASSCTCK
jgi:hypothetical protein